MKKLLCLVFILAVLTVGACAAWEDVPENHWAADAITEMEAMGIVNGYPDGTFHPDNALTRAQFLAMVIRAAAPEGTDVSDRGFDWWYGYRLAADDFGLLEHLYWEHRSQYMDAPIARQEAAELMVRANEAFNGLSLTTNSRLLRFTDDGAGNRALLASIQSASHQDLIAGYPDGSFRPYDLLTRAEGCTLIQRLMAKEGLLAEGETQVLNAGDYLIKHRFRPDGSAVLTSVRQSDRAVIQTMEVPMDSYDGMAELRKSDPDTWDAAFGRSVSGSQGDCFWGLIGYYTYDGSGRFTQVTDRAVLSWVLDPARDGIRAISDQPGTRDFFYSGGVINWAGNEVLWVHEDGTVETLLSNTPAHGLNLTDITAVLDGVVRVKHEFVMGMADLHSYEYAVENGKLRALVHEPGDGWSGYTEEETAREQQRLDEAGCGVGSVE